MDKILKIVMAVVIVCLPVYFSLAQFVPDQLVLLSSPESPSPGETVTIQANTPTLDKNRLFFDWVVDGKRRADFSDLGKNSIKLTAGNVGSIIRVTVNVTGADKEVKPASLNINVSDLALTWTAETYVPPWYKGKALPTQNSVVRVAAIPKLVIGGSAVSPENLIYNWSLDDQENIVSGIGLQIFRFRMSDLPRSNHQIEVTVQDNRGIIHKNGRLLLGTVRPQAKIYASSPLGGIEFRSSPLFTFIKLPGLLDFVIEPFFFAAISPMVCAKTFAPDGTDNPRVTSRRVCLNVSARRNLVLSICSTSFLAFSPPVFLQRSIS